jgi:hypothetical protein
MFHSPDPRIAHVPLDPKTSASPVMIALVQLRCRQHLRYAIEFIRSNEPSRAAYHLGIAEGQALVLYDTACVAWRYKKAVRAIYRALDHLLHRAADKMLLQFSYPE